MFFRTVEPKLLVNTIRKGSKMKIKEKEKAIKLRSQGESIKEIAKYLNVAKSSVSLWTRHIKLTAEQRQKLDKRTLTRRFINGEKIRNTARIKRIKFQNLGRQLFKKYILDANFAAGCALYWAEGSKDRSTASVVNSDPELNMSL